MLMPRSLAFIMVLLLAWTEMAAAEPDLPEVTAAIGTSRGLLVHLGASDGSLVTAWARSGPVLTLAVAGDAAGEERIRKNLLDAGVHGQATVVTASVGRIPLVAATAAQVVADLDALPGLTRAEVLRILRPYGRAWIRSQGAWTVAEQPRDPRLDDWPQYHHDGAGSDVSRDEVAGPANALQWTSGPTSYTKEGVRVQGHVLVMEDGDDSSSRPSGLLARDAFSGLPLWRRTDLEPASRFTLMLDQERVYLHPKVEGVPGPAMIALDLHSGETVATFDRGLTFPAPATGRAGSEMKRVLGLRRDHLQARLEGHYLLQIAGHEAVMLDARSGDPLWRKETTEDRVWCHPVLSGDALYLLEGVKANAGSYTHWPASTVTAIHALDASTGRKRWTWTRPADLPELVAYTMTLGSGHLALACRDSVQGKATGWILTLRAADGAQVFASRDTPRSRQTNWSLGNTHSGFRATFVGDRLWLSSIIEFYGSMPAHGGSAEDYFLAYRGMERPVGCTVFRYTPSYALGSLTAYALDGSGVQHTDVARTACDVGAFPANGLTYITPNHCFCSPYLPGSSAFRPQPFPGAETLKRLERGPATPAAPRESGSQTSAWRMLMANNGRGSWIDDPIQGSLKPVWSVSVPGDTARPERDLADIWDAHYFAHGPVTQASAADGVVVVALSHRQVVVAYDPATGRELWRTPVDGRVDSAPTIAAGLVLCGTREGLVYALNRDDGRLVWRFLAAPRRERIVADGQLESPWPVMGTVNVTDEGVWVVAGRHTDVDGGLWWWRLDTATGRPLADGRIGSDTLKDRTYGSGGPRFDLPTGAVSPPVLDQGLFLLTRLFLRIEAGRLVPWQPDPDAETGERGIWSRTHDLRVLVPGQQPLLSPAWAISAYKMPGYAYTQARMYAHKGDDFVMVGGVTVMTHRGGQGGSIVRRMRRLPEIAPLERTDSRGRAKVEHAGSEEIWTQFPNEGRGSHVTAIAVAGNRVLIGRGAERDRIAAPPYRLVVLDLADGSVVQELDLPAEPIAGGISSDDGRVFVVTDDGTLSAFAP